MTNTEQQAREMLAALKAAREVLDVIAVNGRKYGAIYSHALTALHKIGPAIHDAEAALDRAPAYWMSGSSEGHEGENTAPLEAADAIEALSTIPAIEDEPRFIPARIKEVMDEGDGFWRTCSGCCELEDGQNVHGYPHSQTFGCMVGSGCGDCGGIGIIWDDIDYDAMAREMLAADDTPSPPIEDEREKIVAWLRQVTSGYVESPQKQTLTIITDAIKRGEHSDTPSPLNGDVVEALKDTLALAEIKWGNLDPGANAVFERARAALSSLSSGEAGFRSIAPKDEAHAAVLQDLARRIDDD